MTAAAFLGELATLYDRQGRTQEALDSWEQSTQRSKKTGYRNPLQELGIADLAIRAGQLERALEVAETLTLPAYQELIRGRVAQEQGRHEEALEHYGETARLWPDNELARYHAARSAEALGQFDRAIELYRHTMRIARETTNAANRIAILRIAEGHPSAAYELLRIHRGRTPLDEQGELLLVELTARLQGPADLQSTIVANVGAQDVIRTGRLDRGDLFEAAGLGSILFRLLQQRFDALLQPLACWQALSGDCTRGAIRSASSR